MRSGLTHPAERQRGAEASALDASEATIVNDDDNERADDGGIADDFEEALLPVLARQEQACALDEEETAARIVFYSDCDVSRIGGGLLEERERKAKKQGRKKTGKVASLLSEYGRRRETRKRKERVQEACFFLCSGSFQLSRLVLLRLIATVL